MKTKFLLLFLLLFAFKGFSQEKDTLVKEKKIAWLLSSNFNLPTVQFTPFTEKSVKRSSTLGSVSFFNSLGAGISLSKAEFNLLSSKKDTTGIDIKNHFGIQAGFLFSRSSGETKEISRFAVYTGISILDFQIGIGREFGDIGTDLNKTFYTISYSIPMNKFLKNTTLVFKNNGGKTFGNRISKINKAFTF